MAVKRCANGLQIGALLVTHLQVTEIVSLWEKDKKSVGAIAAQMHIPRRYINDILQFDGNGQVKQEKANEFLEKSLSRAYRSNLPVRRNDLTREWEAKIIPQGGNGDSVSHCGPDGLPDQDYLRTRNLTFAAA